MIPFCSPDVSVASCYMAEMIGTVGNPDDVREFMAQRIAHHGNEYVVISLLQYVNSQIGDVLMLKDIPWVVLLPSFVLSELKAVGTYAVLAVGFIGAALVIMRKQRAKTAV